MTLLSLSTAFWCFERSVLQTWNAQSIRKLYLSLKVPFAVYYFIYLFDNLANFEKVISKKLDYFWKR